MGPAADGRLWVGTPEQRRVLSEVTARFCEEVAFIEQARELGWVDAEAWRNHYETWLAGRGILRGEWWWALGVEIWLRRHW